jgi:hypothetical protein
MAEEIVRLKGEVKKLGEVLAFAISEAEDTACTFKMGSAHVAILNLADTIRKRRDAALVAENPDQLCHCPEGPQLPKVYGPGVHAATRNICRRCLKSGALIAEKPAETKEEKP